MQEDHLTLFELNSLIKGNIKKAFPDSFWVVAEISELKINYSGHCYLELVEKDTENQTLKAKARATIWSSYFRMIQPYFETTAHVELTAGLMVMVKASVEFHELYGFSLNITDIEPRYTLGELARQKQEVINRLMQEGVFDLNKQTDFPRLPQKIAVISSETAAGYGDFKDQLLNNPYNYVFYIKLFPAVMQGEDAETSIISAMERVFEYESFFDTLVIIRGGGAQSDLSCFNNYLLASHIAQFSLPVLTGIGHEQDETVADMVAHTRLKTPTAVAEFLLAKYHEEENFQYELSSSLTEASLSILNNQNNRLTKLAYAIKPLIQSVVESSKKRLAIAFVMIKSGAQKLLTGAHNKSALMQIKMESSSKHFLLQKNHIVSILRSKLVNVVPVYIKQQNHALDIFTNRNHYNDPQNILKRGYSITLFKGKPVKDAASVKKGDLVDTVLHRGKIQSRVTEIEAWEGNTHSCLPIKSG
ncbi:MAG: exodeoxyribonuclease VII large subunit [Bacteroidales bacterium]|nr:exodeoxyribonuclease VII large subunit [Bacteroidales bacterium]MBN2764559.1 exodeoxyribonuclease VII large subunit [Bacteroidales bacterium]